MANYNYLLLVYLFCYFIDTHCQQDQTQQKQLTIYAIPYSHNDLGWLDTPENYFNGSRQHWGEIVNIHEIIDSYKEELQKDEKKKFMQVEMGFLKMWWNIKDDEQKQQYIELIQKGQLEIVGGGWCTNDEATTYYENIIENFWVGHRFALKELGVKPQIGWNVDDFGHSAVQASLFQQMGFNGQFFSRIDKQDKEQRLKEKNMLIMMDHQQYDETMSYPLFTEITYNGYYSPTGFDIDAARSTKTLPGIDTPEGLKKQSKKLYDYFVKQGQHYQGNILMHIFGNDNEYRIANLTFGVQEKLFNYINGNPDQFNNMHIKWATPSEYLNAINGSKDLTLKPEVHDFFPYSDAKKAYWTGYFTSRVADKKLYREFGKKVLAFRTYLGLLKFDKSSEICEDQENKIENIIQENEEVLGMLQHHDASTGTETQKVSNYYKEAVLNATDKIEGIISEVFNEQIDNQYGIQLEDQWVNYNWNQTSKEWKILYNNLENQKDSLLNIYNPTLDKQELILIKVPHSQFEIISIENDEVQKVEVICKSFQDRPIMEMDVCQAYFIANLQGYNINLFKIVYNEKPKHTIELIKQKIDHKISQTMINLANDKKLKIYNPYQDITYSYFDTKQQKMLEKTFNIKYEFYTPHHSSPHSGAYLFSPDERYKSQLYNTVSESYFYKGEIISNLYLIGNRVQTEISFQNYDQNLNNVVKINTHAYGISSDFKEGAEVVLNIQTKIKNKGIFYTDSNGLNMMKRQVNERFSYNYTKELGITPNFYPINSIIQIEDLESQETVTLLNDRSQGGSSLVDGQIQMLIHRRLYKDDQRGLGKREVLNEIDQKTNQHINQSFRHWLVFGDQEDQYNQVRKIQFDHDLESFVFIYNNSNIFEKKFLQKYIPTLVQNLKDKTKFYFRYFGFKSNDFMMRLHNFDQNGENYFKISQKNNSVLETTLTSINDLQKWKDLNEIKWNYDYKDTTGYKLQKQEILNDNNQEAKFEIGLMPFQIRTFNITQG